MAVMQARPTKVLLLFIVCQIVFLCYSWSKLQRDNGRERSCNSDQSALRLPPSTANTSASQSARRETEGALRDRQPVQRQAFLEKESAVVTEIIPYWKRGSMTVSILVARREKATIYYLLENLLREPRAAEDFIIIVHVSHSVSRDEELLGYLRRLKDVVTVVEEKPYPKAMEENIADTRGDSMERAVWRTTHVMDYINLLARMLSYNTTYNLVLEDDVKPAKYALHKAYEFAVMLENQTDWGFLTFYSGGRGKIFVSDARKTWLTGACAWLYRKDVAEGCMQMLRKDPQRWPVDWLAPQYVFNKLDLTAYERTPNLFQHISATSTYTGQDAYKRKAETWRSRSFESDEDNSTLALTPALNADGYMGCFVDQQIPMHRDLSGLFSQGSQGNFESCKSYCRDYFYFGIHTWYPHQTFGILTKLTHQWILVILKDHILLRQLAGVMYWLPCGNCTRVYIAQTGRTLDQCLKEHRRTLVSGNVM